MDFVHDQLSSGRKFRVLTVIDKWNRQCIALHVDFALTGQSVVNALQGVCHTHGLPTAIRKSDQAQPGLDSKPARYSKSRGRRSTETQPMRADRSFERDGRHNT
jgi:putative transposase